MRKCERCGHTVFRLVVTHIDTRTLLGYIENNGSIKRRSGFHASEVADTIWGNRAICNACGSECMIKPELMPGKVATILADAMEQYGSEAVDLVKVDGGAWVWVATD